MSQNNNEKLPSNPIEAQGLLIKAIYEKFGKEVLPIIRDICKRQGKSLGLKLKNKIPNNNLSTVARAFSKSFDQNFVEIVTISDKKFQIRGTRCPFGLENTSRELCEAVMVIDHEYFRETVGDRIKLKIAKTLAAGDPFCDTIYELDI